MNADALLEFCLSLVQSEESFPFGEETSVFKTTGNNKVFAIADLNETPMRITLKVDPQDNDALCAEFPDIIPGYHMNKKHWITVVVGAGVPDDLVEDLIRGSHDLVRPKVRRAPTTP
jgi:predicted DNA-binding protein (MmcQ/YjbR family)